MDIETVDEYRAKWLALRPGTRDEHSAWEMYKLAVNVFEETNGHAYVRPEIRETPNDT